uniref:Strictosidine synthase conserved region domain-containing protein n=1 Tax=Globodera rostochiensis TaxID=31243 RepID=A0A914H078_GLORO
MALFNHFVLPASITFLAFAVWFNSNDFKPKEFHLPPPPALIGPLAPNKPKVLDKLLEGQILAPESIVIEKNVFYTCTKDGKCVKIVDGKIQKSVSLTGHKNCDGKRRTLPYCGRSLGLRRYNANLFIAADAILGIFAIDFEKNSAELLVSSSKLVDGKKMLFPDDLDFPDNDTILFSDASTRFGLPDFLLAFMEHADDARIIEYKFSTGQLRVLVDGLNFANGVQIHPDRQSVLFCESASSRIQRYYYAGPKKGRQQIFVDNLPGFPDNIRLSASRQSLYVALFGHRSKDSPDWFDLLGPWPMARKFLGELIMLLPDSLRPYVYSLAPYGIVLEISLSGNILRSYHDPEGTVIQRISQVCDDGGAYLYLASFENNYIGRISKSFA